MGHEEAAAATAAAAAAAAADKTEFVMQPGEPLVFEADTVVGFLGDVGERLVRLRHELHEAKAEIQHLQMALLTREKAAELWQKHVAQARKEAQDSLRTLRDVEAQSKEQGETIEALKKQVESLRAEVKDKDAQISAQVEEAASRERLVALVASQCDEAQKHARSLMGQMRVWKEGAQVLHKQHAAVVERLQAAMREKEETEEELRTVSAASNRNEKLVNKLQRDLLRLRGLSEDLRAQLRTADAKLTASRAREKKLQTQRDDLNAKLEQINRAAHDQQWKAVSELMARLPSA